jgi:hypothetical protein
MCDTIAIADRHSDSVTEPKRDTVAVTVRIAVRQLVHGHDRHE